MTESPTVEAPAGSEGAEQSGGRRGGPLPRALRRRLIVSSIGLVVLAGVAIGAVVSAMNYSSKADGASKTIANPIGFVRSTASTPPSFHLSELADPSIQMSLANFKGRPLLVNFWSSTCTVCAQEAPALAEAYRQLGAKIAFVGIDTAEPSRASGLAFAKAHKMTYQLLFDNATAVADRYAVPGLPVTFFISSSGKLLGENLGALTVPSLDKLAHKLFGVSPVAS